MKLAPTGASAVPVLVWATPAFGEAALMLVPGPAVPATKKARSHAESGHDLNTTKRELFGVPLVTFYTRSPLCPWRPE